MVSLSTELRLTAVIAVYALFKMLEDFGIVVLSSSCTTDSNLAVLVNDVLYGVGHAYIYMIFKSSTSLVLTNTKLSTMEKLQKSQAMKSILTWIFVRAVAMWSVRSYFNHHPVLIATLLINSIASADLDAV